MNQLNESSSDMVWTLCALCQTVTDEKLIDPSLTKFVKSGVHCGYQGVVENILTLYELGKLALPIKQQLLEQGRDMKITFEANRAVWHRTCKNKIDNQKVERASKAAEKHKCNMEDNHSPVKTRKMVGHTLEKTQCCFFCGADESSGKLFSVRTFSVDKNVRDYAEALRDRFLLGKLSEGDLHALDARYHQPCMLSLRNRYKALMRKQSSSDAASDKCLDGIVLSELVFFIEEQRGRRSVFRLSDLSKSYDKRMLELDPTYNRKVNSTRLKERLLTHIGDLKAQRQGKDIVLLFDADMADIVRMASQDDDAIHLARAAQIVRREILAQDYSFEGTFETGAEESVVPPSLRALIGMMMHGTRFENGDVQNDAKLASVLSISEIIMFNSKKKDIRTNAGSSSKQYHARQRETPLAIYIGLMLHFKTRQKDIIDKLSDRGLCISYSRTMEIVTQLGSSVCSRFEQEGCVCPPKLKENLFTVGAVDNIDHNTSSLRSKESFHGTAVSLTQFPTADNLGLSREMPLINTEASNSDATLLPPEYTNLPEVSITRECYAPKTLGDVRPLSDLLLSSREKENDWLSNVATLIKKDPLEEEDYISWAAYHANKQQPVERQVCSSVLLPLFTDKAQSASMMLHAMNLVKLATQRLNPSQVPVITADMPLYAICKQIQWQQTQTHGEDNYVIMLGGLHIEMNILKLIGDWLNGSGWKTALIQANVTTTGRADAIASGSQITRARYAHQVTAAALHLLQQKAYQQYLKYQGDAGEKSLSSIAWHEKQFMEQPQFTFWSMALYLELLYLQFVRSLRSADFKL